MEGIQVSVSKAGLKNNVSVIKVGGYIDTTTSAEVERALDSILRAGSYNIVIDLGNVDYISSAGWGIFISEIKGIREKGGDLKLVNMIPDVYEVFELLEFHYILKAFDTMEEAIGAFDLSSFKPAKETILEMGDRQDAGARLDDFSGEEKAQAKAKTVETSSKQSFHSVEDKIRQIILEKPDLSFLEIKKALNTEGYNYTKIGILDTWKRLRKMGLSSKKKRVSFFKKKAFQA